MRKRIDLIIVETFIRGFLMLIFEELCFVVINAIPMMLCWNYILVPLNIFAERIGYFQMSGLLAVSRFFYRIVKTRTILEEFINDRKTNRTKTKGTR